MPLDHDDLIPTDDALREAGGVKPIGRATLYRWIKAGRISPPLKIGPNTVRFSRSKLRAELGLQTAA